MKKFICYLIFFAVSETVVAQDFNLSKIVKPGTKLIYQVSSGDKTYDFTITVKDKKGSSFKWEMTGPVKKSGTILHTTGALQNAVAMHNYFGNGIKKLDNNTLSVWLSQKVFNHLDKSVGKPVKIYPNGMKSEALNMGTYTGALQLEIIVDGETQTISEELASPLVKSGKDYIVSSRNEFFTYNPEKTFPIILRMDFGFSLVLKEVRTK